jgi:hypothetical protein
VPQPQDAWKCVRRVIRRGRRLGLAARHLPARRPRGRKPSWRRRRSK